MYPQPNPTEAAAQALAAAQQRIAADPPVALHEFKPDNASSIVATCVEVVGGAMCCRPRAHGCHNKPIPTDRCDICRNNRGSWLDCRCQARCKSPCCRYEIEDHFDFTTVPVPTFRKD